MNVLEIFGIIFIIEISVIVITVVCGLIFGLIGKYNTRKNYLDIMKLDGEMRKKQAEYFENNPEEFEKWKAINAMNESRVKEKEENENNKPVLDQNAINDILKNAIQN